MNAIHINKENINAILFGLSVACPIEGGNPEDCFLRQLRNLKVRERLSYIKELSIEEKFRMYNRHKECFDKKLKKE